VFEAFVDAVSGSGWSYLVVFAVAMIDAFFPAVPSEATAITAGVVAGAGDLSAPLCILAAGSGAVVGDNVSYGLGTWLGEHTVKRFLAGEKRRQAFHWAERQLAERGAYIIVVARFIPGGRTATTFTAGYVHTLRWRRFIVYDLVAGAIWGTYTVMLGYFGGRSFEEQPWKGLLLAFAIAVAVTLVIEAVRHLRKRRASVV
jgi:membrane protein DedA with SNARE-associated domain